MYIKVHTFICKLNIRQCSVRNSDELGSVERRDPAL